MNLLRIAKKIAYPIYVEETVEPQHVKVIEKAFENYPVPIKFYNIGKGPNSKPVALLERLRTEKPVTKSDAEKLIQKHITELDEDYLYISPDQLEHPKEVLNKSLGIIKKADDKHIHFMSVRGVNYNFSAEFGAGWVAHDFVHAILDFPQNKLSHIDFLIMSPLTESSATLSKDRRLLMIDMKGIICQVKRLNDEAFTEKDVREARMTVSMRRPDYCWSFVNEELKLPFAKLNLESVKNEGQSTKGYQENQDVVQSMAVHYIMNPTTKSIDLPKTKPKEFTYKDPEGYNIHVSPGNKFQTLADYIDGRVKEAYQMCVEALNPDLVKTYLAKFVII
jgi:hypothetical protein